MRSGEQLTALKALVESYGAIVVAIAVVIYQPHPDVRTFGDLPLLYLTRLEASYWADGGSCELCRKSLPLEKVWV